MPFFSSLRQAPPGDSYGAEPFDLAAPWASAWGERRQTRAFLADASRELMDYA